MEQSNEMIRQVLKQLRMEEKELEEQQRTINRKLDNIRNRITDCEYQFPMCESCGKPSDPEHMVIATEEDVANWEDANEGFSNPIIGEYYCGC